MPRSAAVTVNYLADPTPLRRGVASANRSLRQFGRGANLNQVARDVSRVSNRMSGMVYGLGQLRLGWYGVGAAATGALAGITAALVRAGRDWDNALSIFERGAGFSIGEIDGLEEAFSDLAGRVPESFAAVAEAFSSVTTAMVAEAEEAGLAINEALAQDIEVVAEVVLDTSRITGIDPNLLSALVQGGEIGVIAEIEGLDALVDVVQGFANIEPQSFATQLRNLQGVTGNTALDLVAVVLGEIAGAAGNTEVLTQFREILGRFAALGLTFDDLLVLLRDLSQQALAAGRTRGGGFSQQLATNELVRLFARPIDEGGLGLTTGAQGLASAFFNAEGLNLDLSERGIANRLEETRGATARGSQLNFEESWMQFVNYFNSEWGPDIRNMLGTLVDLFGGQIRHVSDVGIGTASWSGIQEFFGNPILPSATAAGATGLNAIARSPNTFNPKIVARMTAQGLAKRLFGLNLPGTAVDLAAGAGWYMRRLGMGGLADRIGLGPTDQITTLATQGPYTTQDENRVRLLVDDALEQMRAEGLVDILKLGKAQQKQLIEEAYRIAIAQDMWNNRNHALGVAATTAESIKMLLQTQGTEILLPGRSSGILSGMQHGQAYGFTFMQVYEEWLEAERAAQDDLNESVVGSGDEFAEAVREASFSLVDSADKAAARTIEAARIQHAALLRLISAAWDMGTLFGANAPRINPAKLGTKEDIVWQGAMDRNTNALDRNTDAMYELADGMIVLEDGTKFQRHDILSSETDADGLNTFTLGSKAVTATSNSAAVPKDSAPATNPNSVYHGGLRGGISYVKNPWHRFSSPGGAI